jgi:hypothetical protein
MEVEVRHEARWDIIFDIWNWKAIEAPKFEVLGGLRAQNMVSFIQLFKSKVLTLSDAVKPFTVCSHSHTTECIVICAGGERGL